MKTNGLHRKKPQCARAAWRTTKVSHVLLTGDALAPLFPFDTWPESIQRWSRAVRNAR